MHGDVEGWVGLVRDAGFEPEGNVVVVIYEYGFLKPVEGVMMGDDVVLIKESG